MSKFFVLIAILAHILTVLHAVDGQNLLTIDFNKANLTSDFDTRPYYDIFTIKSYTDLLLEPFRNGSEKYLTVSRYGMWTCIVTKATYKLEKNANISLAINISSSYPADHDQSNVQITIFDMDSGLEYRIFEAGVTNGWKLFKNTFEKTIENAKIDIKGFISSDAHLAIEYIQIANPQTETTAVTTEISTESDTELSTEPSNTEPSTESEGTPIELIIEKSCSDGSKRGSLLFKFFLYA